MRNKFLLGLGILLLLGLVYTATNYVKADGCAPVDDVSEDNVRDDCVEETPVDNAGLLRKYMKVTAPDIISVSLGVNGDSQSGTYEITWVGPMFVKTVNLLYTTDDGKTYTEIVANQDNTGSYMWTLPNINADQVKIRVSGRGADGYNYGSDLSNAFFAIRNV